MKRVFLLSSTLLYLFQSCGTEQKHDPDKVSYQISERERRVYPTTKKEIPKVKEEVGHDQGQREAVEDDTVNGLEAELTEQPGEASEGKSGDQEQAGSKWFAPIVDPIKNILPKRYQGEVFLETYKKDYEAIATKVLRFHAGGSKWSCAAYASAALKHYGLPIDEVLVTNQLEAQFLKLGYKKVNLSLLKPGDLVFTTKAGSNLKDTYSHVFVHGGYTGPLRRESKATDNKSSEYIRPFAGNATNSKAVIAYRPDYN